MQDSRFVCLVNDFLSKDVCGGEIDPYGVGFRAVGVVEGAGGDGAGVEPVEVGFYFFGCVRWAHVDCVWVVAEVGPFWLDDTFEVF